MHPRENFCSDFELLTGHGPFPWQQKLFGEFLEQRFPEACDIPTDLGKTSRLLFTGYGCGFKSKSLHAGFLGQDALLVHDEAHPEPAFQKLIAAIAAEQQQAKPQSSTRSGLRCFQSAFAMALATCAMKDIQEGRTIRERL